MVASTYRRDPRSSIRAGTEANTTALLLPARLICSVPTDHAGAAGCTTAPVSPDGWVYFQMNFHITPTNLLLLQRLSMLPIE